MWTCSPSERLVRRQAELRTALPGADRLVRVGLDAGGHADERVRHARLARALDLVERVEHDERACLGRGSKLRVVLVVPVHDERVARDAGPLREPKLAERRDVGAEPFLGEQLHDRHVRERLRAVGEQRVGRGGPVRACARPNRRLAEDEQRRPVLPRQLGRANPAELELALVHGRGLGKELEHRQDCHGLSKRFVLSLPERIVRALIAGGVRRGTLSVT